MANLAPSTRFDFGRVVERTFQAVGQNLVVFLLLSGLLIVFTGWAVLDPIVSLVIVACDRPALVPRNCDKAGRNGAPIRPRRISVQAALAAPPPMLRTDFSGGAPSSRKRALKEIRHGVEVCI